jgi:hypothetical protein
VINQEQNILIQSLVIRFRQNRDHDFHRTDSTKMKYLDTQPAATLLDFMLFNENSIKITLVELFVETYFVY